MIKSGTLVLSSALFAVLGFHAGQYLGPPAMATGDDVLVTGSLPQLQTSTALQQPVAWRPPREDMPVLLAQAMPPAMPPVYETDAPAAQPAAAAMAAAAGRTDDKPANGVVDLAPAAPEATPVVAAASAMPDVDESALRFFAQRGDTVRLQAEIARLKALYPDWQPPADPLAPKATVDAELDRMWKLYGAGQYDALHKAIAERQQKQAGWQPPSELASLLQLADARERLVAASDGKRYEEVIAEGAAHPGLLVCDEVDMLWRVAEAFAKTDRAQRAEDAYRYVLGHCDVTAERSATMQKAASLLPPETVRGLLALERKTPAGTGEFDGVRDDLARQFMAAGAKDATAIVSPDDVTRMEKLAETEHRAGDALLLGWYNERRGKMTQAEVWFRKARAADDTAEAAQGLALVLIARKAPQEAEDILYRWRAASDDAHKTYLAAAANVLALDPPIVLQPDVLARMGREASEARDGALAEQFGWYARAFNQQPLALQWFATSLTWQRDNEPAAYGLALTARELKMASVFARLQSDWGPRSARIANIGKAGARAEATAHAMPVVLAEYLDGPRASAGDGAPARAIETVAPIASAQARETAVAGAPLANAPLAGAPAAVAPAASVAPVRSSAQRAPAAQQTASLAYVSDAEPAAQPAPRRRKVAGAHAAARKGCTGFADAQTLAPAAALQRGWCLMELNRPAEASRSFGAALKSSDSRTRGDAAYGQSLAYLRMGLTENAAAAATKGPMDQHKASELQVALLTNKALAAFKARRYSEALLLLDRRAELTPERADLMVLRGYAYMSMNQYGNAIQIFESLAATGNRDAIKGLAEAREAKNPIPGG
ncbi:cellulose synthase [Rhizobium rhizosphaerae]|nr:cellulose synthase [Xaviernesmea rhizosphaerae]